MCEPLGVQEPVKGIFSTHVMLFPEAYEVKRKCQQKVVDVKPEAYREEYGGGYLILSGVDKKDSGRKQQCIYKKG